MGLTAVIRRRIRGTGASPRFRLGGIHRAARAGAWLLVRTLALQASITATTLVAGRLGAVPLASHQVLNAVWSLLAYALDALAIAAQAMTGRHLGAGEIEQVRRLTGALVRWGAGFGGVLALIVLVSSTRLGHPFTSDRAVWAQVTAVAPVLAALLPVAGVVFVLDGILIGAGDARYLARAGLVVTAIHLPCVIAVAWFGAGLTWIWLAYGVTIVGRATVLGLRSRGSAWLRPGAPGAAVQTPRTGRPRRMTSDGR